ncbi:TIGR03086 family metal-binding protein [Kitasatospora purpeofusca]|uniref:TIGR03086 family metal-binding protein n=1 Tax=Kitasatospora purpeofusca TaxID=67352 RepID=UPI002A5A9926|nr:TIGR03086 family metal-binding protein [Kitasatospora purpeofusca]MDY0810989.1 TIGR03086 family metal-binding protein [Kitasatospora purpeofusca]
MRILELHTRALELAGAVVDTVQPEQLVLATPCAGRPLRWLLEHVVGQHRGFAAAALGAGADRAHWRDVPVHGDPAGAFRQSAERLTAAFATAGAAAEPAPLYLPEIGDGGPFPLDRAIGFQLLDTLVHAWDVAAALGSPARLVAAVEAEPPLVGALLTAAGAVPATAPDRGPGRAFAAVRTVPAGTGPFDRALALLGRDPSWPAAVR